MVERKLRTPGPWHVARQPAHPGFPTMHPDAPEHRQGEAPVMAASVAGTRPITAADVRAPGATLEPLREVVAHTPRPWCIEFKQGNPASRPGFPAAARSSRVCNMPTAYRRPTRTPT